MWGVRKGVWGGGHLGPEAQNLHVHVRIFYYVTWDYQKKSKISNEEVCREHKPK